MQLSGRTPLNLIPSMGVGVITRGTRRPLTTSSPITLLHTLNLPGSLPHKHPQTYPMGGGSEAWFSHLLMLWLLHEKAFFCKTHGVSDWQTAWQAKQAV